MKSRFPSFLLAALLPLSIGSGRAQPASGEPLTPAQEAALQTLREDLFFQGRTIEEIDAAVSARRREFLEANRAARPPEPAPPPAPQPAPNGRPPRETPPEPPPPEARTVQGWFLGADGESLRIVLQTGEEMAFPLRPPRVRGVELSRTLRRDVLGFACGDRLEVDFYPDAGSAVRRCVLVAPRELQTVAVVALPGAGDGVHRARLRNGRDEIRFSAPVAGEEAESLAATISEVEPGEWLAVTFWEAGGRKVMVALRWDRLGERKQRDIRQALLALRQEVAARVEEGETIPRGEALESLGDIAALFARFGPAAAEEVRTSMRGESAPEGFHEQVRLLSRMIEEGGK